MTRDKTIGKNYHSPKHILFDRRMTMTTEIKAKLLVPLPPQIAKKLNLHKGDLLDIAINEDGTLLVTPIVIKPKKYVEEMERELAELKQQLGVDQPAEEGEEVGQE